MPMLEGGRVLPRSLEPLATSSFSWQSEEPPAPGAPLSRPRRCRGGYPRGGGWRHADPSPHFLLVAASEDIRVRLVNSSSRCAGRVEVFRNKQWGTVCDADWDLPDAEVVCRQLDCGRALSAPGGSQFGQGSGFIWMSKTKCWGPEEALADCQAMTWGVSDCSHRRDAGAVCSGEPPSSSRRARRREGSMGS